MPIKKRIDTINSLTEPLEVKKQLNILAKEIGMETTVLIGFAEALSNQRQLIDAITRNKKIDPDEKRQIIDDTYRMMIMIAKRGNELISK